MNNIKSIYNSINNPSSLLEFMDKYINYGYLDKNGVVHHFDDIDFNDNWYEKYILESSTEVLENRFGNCWDQVEFERDWFLIHDYEIKTFYEMVQLDYDNPYPTHTFLIYKDEEDNWNWFENADFDNRGIHKFSSLDELLKYQYNNYVSSLKKANISKEELDKIIITEYLKPKIHSTAEKFISHVINSKEYKLR